MTAYNPSGNDYHFGGAVVTWQDRNDDGTLSPQRRLGNVSAFAPTTNTTVSEHMSSYTKIRELDLAVPTAITRTFAMTLDNFAARNLAMHDGGIASLQTVAGVTGKQDTITAPQGVPMTGQRVIGFGYRLGVTDANPDGDFAIDFSAGNAPVVKQSGNTLTEGTDYYFDADGLLTFVQNTSSAFQTGVSVTVTYATMSETFEYIVSGDKAFYGQMHVYEQLVVGRRRHYRFPFVLLTPTGETALITDAVRTMQFEGRSLRGAEPAMVVRSMDKLPNNLLL
jgi:hypothetical protein